MQLTIMGKSPAWQDAGGACSGYLLEESGFRLLVDCGPGVFAKLRELRDYLTVDAVLLSHMHGDHILDLIPFSYALLYSPRQRVSDETSPGSTGPVRPRLYAPPGGVAMLRALVGTFASADLIESAFDVHEYDPTEQLAVGPLHVRFAAVPHFVPTHALDFTAQDGTRLTFSADCGPNDALVSLARDTDLLLIESTAALETPSDDGSRGHLTAIEAGEHARRADAARVLLTHFSDEYDADQLVAAASGSFGRPVGTARAGETHALHRANH